jgi:DNA-binding XRE family transcriptional regulator
MSRFCPRHAPKIGYMIQMPSGLHLEIFFGRESFWTFKVVRQIPRTSSQAGTMERNIQLDWSSLVAEAIRRRKQQRLTQKHIALIAEVSKPTVVKFERQSGNITLEAVFSILRVVGLLKNPG